ncbi:cell wall metabolism sensor histidine kinase WalK [Cohnella sp. REN36]|uniref:sensor histidine kinase n=1 Tax=Cohnella sp. REN36 TaxID=2887347 RepID=UPI001D13FC4F|nr:HAMP domain-containing sensor histidine kinase [Cohnella sp. REN36]MCC3371446.1 HAMP domain-containing histidine kinase [Cohnella sp. REN36]
MRTLRIRTFTLICFLLILALPWMFYLSAHLAETKSLSLKAGGPQNERNQRLLTEAVRQIEENADRWTDPEWQNRMQARLQEARLGAEIRSASDQVLFRFSPETQGAFSSAERFTVIRDGQVVGRVVVQAPKSNVVSFHAAIAGFVLALAAIAAAMRRLLLKPLERIRAAVLAFAAGEWDVRLPASRITEIAAVRDGFEGMVEGLRRSHQKQAELEEERRFVIAAVAHDLRTPLFALRGYLDGLEQGIAQTPEQMAKYVAVCKDKSAQLDRLVEDLFTFTKMEYADTSKHERTIDLKRILEGSMDSLRPPAENKHISIETHLEAEAAVKGDAHLLERAMNNLLDNAVRHAPVHGQIAVRCVRDGGKVRFSFRDTGPGFTEEELQRVFEPLYRGEASRNRLTGGSGLGLTISRRILRQHGGDLAAGNHPEGGALLTGWIPAAEDGDGERDRE